MERDVEALEWNLYGAADWSCSNSWNCVHRELHRREIRSDVMGNFMQNDNTHGRPVGTVSYNTHGRPVGTVSYNEVAEGTAMDDAGDADLLLFVSTDVFFSSAL